MTSENRTWDSLKNDYLRQIEKTLASVKHPRSKEVIQDVGSHLDRRFAELEPEEQTWENFQAIITEMGPASDYAELLEPGAAPLRRSAWRKYALWVGLAATIVSAAAILSLVTRRKFPETLNEAQTLYRYWTETRFNSFLNRDQYADLAEPARKQLEEKWLKMLERAGSPEYYDAINSLAAIKSKRALKPLLEIATDRREKDNRDRWMATRALGIVGDESIVPQLIHLVYHYNQNTRFWAQISLVRLTGVNFSSDWQAWGQWWNRKNGNPPFLPERITWTSRADWADEGFQKETDKAFIERQKQTENQPEQSSVETYIIKFKPVRPFEPQTSRELLDTFNEKHPPSVRTHHYRTEVRDNSLIGYICVDTKAGRDAVVTMLQKSEKLELLEADLATTEALERLNNMRQPSLGPQDTTALPPSLEQGWNCVKLFDDSTKMALATFENYYFQQYHIETGYESASETQKGAMVERWLQEIRSPDYDTAVRAAVALGDAKTPEVAGVLAEVASAQKGSNRVKWIAVRGLAKMAVRETVPALITLIDHHNANVRTYAKVALAEISGEFFGDSKEKWRDWARSKGVEVKEMDVGQEQVSSADAGSETVSRSTAQTTEKLEFSLYDAFGRDVHSQDYEGVPVFLEFGACW